MGASIDTTQNRAYRRDRDPCHGWGEAERISAAGQAAEYQADAPKTILAIATISADNFYCYPK